MVFQVIKHVFQVIKDDSGSLNCQVQSPGQELPSSIVFRVVMVFQVIKDGALVFESVIKKIISLFLSRAA